MEAQLSYREVVPHQSAVRRWKDIPINTGAVLSTLQDIKLPDCAGGYAYNDSNKSGSVNRNRFIYWKISNDVLELVEQSLDYNLTFNQVRYRFQDTPVLEGISIHETNSEVIILVATVSSVHRLKFTHPTRLQSPEHIRVQSSDQALPSVFSEALVTAVRDPSNFHVLNPSVVGTSLPHTAASWLTIDGEAIFAVASAQGHILIIRMPRSDVQGNVTTHELRQSSVMQRLWTGFIPPSIRGSHAVSESAISLCLHALGEDTFVFALCRDSKLRMWSCTDYENVMEADLLEHLPESLSQYRKQQGPQPHIMRKALGSTQNYLYLGIFLCFAERKQICIVKPVHVLGEYHLEVITTVHGPEYRLIDFSLTVSHVWALWTNSDSETLLNFTSTDGETSANLGWIPVTLEPPTERDFHVPEGLVEPREAFMQQIFKPGNFSVHTISKAINIYRRSVESAIMGDINVPISVLKEEVSAVVEKNIHAQANEYELSDEDYLLLQLECWSKFYSCCVQYQEVETKMMGLLLDHNTGMIAIIKKSLFSLLRPQDTIEFLVLSKGRGWSDDFGCLAALSDDPAVHRDMVTLSKCLALLNAQQTDDMKDAFEHDLFHQQTPDTIAPVILTSLLSNTEESILPQFHQELAVLVSTMPHLIEAITLVLSEVDLAHGQPEGLAVEDGFVLEASRQLSCTKLFSSELGASLIAESVHQLAQIRLSVCRDLLLFLFWLLRSGEQVGVSASMDDKIRSELIPQTNILTEAYYILLWTSITVAGDTPRNTMESGLCQLSLLNITDSFTSSTMFQKASLQPVTLVELFVQLDGGTQGRMILARNQFLDVEFSTTWTHYLCPLIIIIGQLLWPVSVHFAFPEFLLVHCQYIQLAEYVRLLQSWCQWNNSSRKFLLGHVYLNLGEPDKATDQFLEVVDRFSREESFLVTKVLQATDEPLSHLVSMYCLRIVRLLEQFKCADQIITLSNAAIGMAERDDPNVPTLLAVIFKFHLELGHNEEAYAAINDNPDASRKKDCLRQFVVTLCDRAQFKELVGFPYIDLHDEVVSILESRARSVDLTTHNYYSLLYSFHITRGHYRKAGSVMYEYGMRLGNEILGLKGKQKQVKAYLAALNCLRLVDQNYAWIVKPVPVSRASSGEMSLVPGISPKRNYDGEEIPHVSVQREMEVLEFDSIKKEYDLLHARLQLYQTDHDLSNISGILSADETVGLLVNAGLYDAALNICSIFKLSLRPIFEGLASRCVKLSQLSHQPTENAEVLAKAWDWLKENDGTKDIVPNEHKTAKCAWSLLERYLQCQETKGLSIYHRCVAAKLLSLGALLPIWLVASYKLRNLSELLMLYLDYDMLEETCALVIEYIDAVMGKGQEYFDLQSILLVNAPPIWMPYTAIDHLLEALRQENSDPMCNHLYHSLNTKLNEYIETLNNVSHDMIELKQSVVNRMTVS